MKSRKVSAFIKLLLLAAVFMLALVSCGGKKSECTHRDADDNGICDKAGCSQPFTDAVDIPKKHVCTPVTREDDRIEPTCDKEGSYTKVLYCKDCGKIIASAKKTVEKLSHTPSEAVEENRAEATCVKLGSYDLAVYCSVCKIEISRETKTIEKSTHTYNADGICDVCGDRTSAPELDADELYVRVGKYIYFGEYPQSIKADDVTVSATTDSRGYYLGSDGAYYAKVISDPHDSNYTFTSGAAVESGEVYYFKVELIRWRILATDGDKMLILCDSIIENLRYADNKNNYRDSEIRAWLNETFYKTAFSELQREIIIKTVVDNSVSSTGNTVNPYICENTEDNVFLLSFAEVTGGKYDFTTSGPDTAERQMQTSDYSRAGGVYMNTSREYYGNGWWWMRSPDGLDVGSARGVYHDGDPHYAYRVDYSNCGVVPAVWIKA